MTTYPITQAPNSNFQFNPTLDGVVYAAALTWATFGQRFYLNVSTLEGDLVCSVPLVGSPDVMTLESLTWANGIVTAQTATPHGFSQPVVTVTIAGCTPSAYNGQVKAIVVNAAEFRYDLAADPGTVTTLGGVAYQINLVGGFFTASTLIFLPDAQQIIITP